jgi:hypothetical protein
MRERKRSKAKKLTAGMFVRMEGRTGDRVRVLAVAEKRPVSTMARILIEEALTARSDRGSMVVPESAVA